MHSGSFSSVLGGGGYTAKQPSSEAKGRFSWFTLVQCKWNKLSLTLKSLLNPLKSTWNKDTSKPSLTKIKCFVKTHPVIFIKVNSIDVRICILPLDGLLLFLDHVCQLLEYRAQLHDSAFNVLHGVCTALDVGIL